MRRPRVIESIGVGLLALGVAAAPIAGLLPVAAADAGTTISSTDFENGTYPDWTQDGTPALSVVTDGSTKALQVANRSQDFDGIQTNATFAAKLTAGTTYTISMKVRLADGTTGAPQVRFVQFPGFTWLGQSTTMTTAWQTVSTTFTAPTPVPADFKLYLGTDNLSPAAAYTYLVDDLVVTGPPAAPATETVVSENFDGSSLGALWPNGSPTITYVDNGTGKAAQVADRAQGYYSVQVPTDKLTAGTTFTVSAKVRADVAATAHFTGKVSAANGSFTWIGTTALVAGEWATLTGTYTVPAAPDSPGLYLEVEPVGGVLPAFLVDDFLLTKPASGSTPDPTPTIPAGFVPGGALNPTTTPVSAAAAITGTGPRAALTFDDGPNPGETETLLDYLKSKNIHATFCVIGQNIQAPGGADVLKRIVAEGHTLCNHSTDYDPMDGLTAAQATQKMIDNLTIIRTALGDPTAQVPFFRAPNGAWGTKLAPAAVSLGMQPLAVTNLIDDWTPATQANLETLKTNLRASLKDGQILLVHDGGGDRTNGVAALSAVVDEKLAEDPAWSFVLPAVTVAPKQPVGSKVINTDFESGLDGWYVRQTGSGSPTAEITTTDVHGGAQAALVSTRTSQGQGLAHDTAGVLVPGTRYDVSAWVKFTGTPTDSVVLSVKHTVAGADKYDNLLTFSGVSSTAWTQVTGTVTLPADSSQVYFETKWISETDPGNTTPLLFDDIAFTVANPLSIETGLTPIKDTLDFPVGAAIQARDTVSPYSDLLTTHFDQITPENFMKPEAWYTKDAAHTFVTENAEADALLDFAHDNGIKIYGHVLVWHGQTPDWFFQDASGRWLTSSPADQQILKDRLRDHIDDVAAYLTARYGAFGNGENPVYAFDVVNETVSDGSSDPEGMRQSRWYKVLGRDFIKLAFQYANEAFNGTYAAPGATHPVTLFINDYDTEKPGKQQRYHDLLEWMEQEGVPFDGIGHQFHVSLSTPVSTLAGALDAMADLGKKQAVTEFDVTTGTPVTEAKLIDQGYYYQDAFNAFREFDASSGGQVFSATVWGLVDGRSWRNDQGAPLVFDDTAKAKKAYYGIVNGTLPAPMRTATVFQGDVALDEDATGALEWAQLPLHAIDGTAGFQLRWEADHLTAFVTVDDATVDAADAVRLTLNGTTSTITRAGDADVDGVLSDDGSTWSVVVHLPLAAAAQGDTASFDVAVTEGAKTVTWNKLGAMGTLSFLEPLSYLETVEAGTAPAIDGQADDVWATATSVTTGKVSAGSPTATGGATAEVRTLWKGDTLYVLATVTDPDVDTTGSDPWTKDSVEIFVDPGNNKNGSYLYNDSQIRINADNGVTFGTGDEAWQRANVTSAVSRTATGYVVEAAIGLRDTGGLGTVHGLDFQVNDASAGARTSIHNWAEPTGTGYLTTERWGVGRLVAAGTDVPGDGGTTGPRLTVSLGKVKAGATLPIALTGFTPGQAIQVVLGDTSLATPTQVEGAGRFAAATVAAPTGTVLATVTADANGAVAATVTIPRSTAVGVHGIGAVVGGAVLAGTTVEVLAADPATARQGALASTGTQVAGLAILALVLVGAGLVLIRKGRRGAHTA